MPSAVDKKHLPPRRTGYPAITAGPYAITLIRNPRWVISCGSRFTVRGDITVEGSSTRLLTLRAQWHSRMTHRDAEERFARTAIPPLACGFSEPEVGVEPTTFRLRGGIFQSDASEGDGFPQVRMEALPIWPDRGGCRRIVGMTMRMTIGRIRFNVECHCRRHLVGHVDSAGRPLASARRSAGPARPAHRWRSCSTGSRSYRRWERLIGPGRLSHRPSPSARVLRTRLRPRQQRRGLPPGFRR
jgi:hypothetical protein